MTFGKIERPRLQYDPPWYKPEWRDLLPKAQVYRGGDECCNTTVYLRLPLLGALTLWKPFGRLRDWPCQDEAMHEDVPLCTVCRQYHADRPGWHDGETFVFVQVWGRWAWRTPRGHHWELYLHKAYGAPRAAKLDVRRWRDAEAAVRDWLEHNGLPHAQDEERVFIHFLW